MKRKFKIFLFLLAVFLFCVRGVSAYIGDPQTFEDSTIGAENQYNAESSTLKTATDLISSFNLLILGPTKEEYIDKFSQKMGGGAIASVGNLIAGMYSNPPASSVTYFADVLHNLGIAKPAYAQGVGFSGMSNLLSLWKASRNLAYIFFIIAFMYIGLAIMFRVKISPQAVISIQNALPKLVIALILVTFSYAIVGLMIDLIYVLINLGVLALGGTEIIDDISSTQTQYIRMNFWGALGKAFENLGRGLSSPNSYGFGVGAGVGTALSSILLAILFFGTSHLALATAGIGIVIILIIGIVVLWQILKLFFSLLSSYISIILSLITAPIQIIIGTIPGSQIGFGSWFKNLMANILVFPAVSIIILLTWILTGTSGPEWEPPILGIRGGALPALIGLGMIFLIAKVPEIVKSAFKIKPSGFGTVIGQAFKPAQPIYKAGATAAVTKLEPDHASLAAIVSTLAGVRGAGRGGGRSQPTTAGGPQH